MRAAPSGYRCDGSLARHAGTLLVMAGLSLSCYYGLWLLYRAGAIHPLGLVGMAAFPVLYYLFLTLRRRNYLALPVLLLFACLHIGITSANFLP